MKKFLVAALFIVTTLLSHQITSAEIQPQVVSKLKSYMDRLELEKAKLQGGAIAILYKDQIIYKRTFGNQRGNKEPITSKTLFPLASVSKGISATAIALLVQQGKLSFEEKFQLPCLKNPVSLIHILGHTTGYEFRGNYEIEQGLPRKRLLSIIGNKIPKSEPGNYYSYSNMLFSLMEEALYTKNISFELVLEELKTLLQQNDIQIPPIDIQTDLAYPHLIDTTDSQLIFKELPFPPHYPRLVPSSAGIFASLDATIEIYKLCFGYRPEILSKESLAHLQTPIKKNYDIHKWNLKWSYDIAQVESYYGLGWRILKAKTHPHTDLICHSGYIAGINTFIGHIPSHEVGIIILTNQDSGFATQEGFKFWAQFLK